MPRIILIETSTSLCSTALIEGDKIVSYQESTTPRSQASLTAVFIKEMLDSRGLDVRDCDAVCVSSGPGSYTGLRVGVSTAKGLCFGADIPLLSVGTLDVLAYQAERDKLLPEGCCNLIPMIDARRMEVYCAVFDAATMSRRSEVEAKVIEPGSFAEELERTTLFIGDGAGKCSQVLSCTNATFIQTCPRADAMLVPTLKAWEEKRFENTAYFEPFYLKQFVTTVSKKNLLQQL